MKVMNNIDNIITESINNYLLTEVWYNPTTWFNKQPKFEPPSEEELAQRRENQRQMDDRRSQVDEYYNKLNNIIQLICRGKETRLLDVCDDKGNQTYSMFEHFVFALLRETENYIYYGTIDSSHGYWQDKIIIIDNMCQFIHHNPRLEELANQIEDGIKWVILYYKNIPKIFGVKME